MFPTQLKQKAVHGSGSGCFCCPVQCVLQSLLMSAFFHDNFWLVRVDNRRPVNSCQLERASQCGLSQYNDLSLERVLRPYSELMQNYSAIDYPVIIGNMEEGFAYKWYCLTKGPSQVILREGYGIYISATVLKDLRQSPASYHGPIMLGDWFFTLWEKPAL